MPFPGPRPLVPARKVVMLALSRLASVIVEYCRLARSRLTWYILASLKFEFSKSPSRISELINLALTKLQSLAITLLRSQLDRFARSKLDFWMTDSLKDDCLRVASLKIQLLRLALQNFTSMA